MYCHQCGTQLPAEANFCAKCGTKIVSHDGGPQLSGHADTATQPLLSKNTRPKLGKIIGTYCLIPGRLIYFQEPKACIDLKWGDVTLDMFLAEQGIVFTPTLSKHTLKKVAINAAKYAPALGGGLGAGGGAALVIAGTALGGAAALAAGLVSKVKDGTENRSSNDSEDLIPPEESVFCLRSEVKVLIFDQKKSMFSSERKFVIEGIFRFPGGLMRQAAWLLSDNGIDDYTKLFTRTGFASESDAMKCSEMEFATYIRNRYRYPPVWTSDIDFDSFLKQVAELEKDLPK